jgi:hypothetical protein
VGNGNLTDFSWNGNTVATRPWATGNNILHSDLSDAPASAHHSKYTNSEAVSAVNAETTLTVDISGDADTVDGIEAADLGNSDSEIRTAVANGDSIPHPVYASKSDVPTLNEGESVFISGDGLYVEDGT